MKSTFITQSSLTSTSKTFPTPKSKLCNTEWRQPRDTQPIPPPQLEHQQLPTTLLLFNIVYWMFCLLSLPVIALIWIQEPFALFSLHVQLRRGGTEQLCHPARAKPPHVSYPFPTGNLLNSCSVHYRRYDLETQKSFVDIPLWMATSFCGFHEANLPLNAKSCSAHSVIPWFLPEAALQVHLHVTYMGKKRQKPQSLSPHATIGHMQL